MHFGRVLFLFSGFLMAVGPARTAETDWLRELGLSAEVPVLALPGRLGKTIGVTSKAGAYNLYQTIALTGDAGTSGQNQIELNLTREGLAPHVTDWEIRQEMNEKLPGIPMVIMDQAGHNRFGIFGLAAGSGIGMNCAFAWQAVDRADSAMGLGEPGFFDERHALTIRIRYCSSVLAIKDIAIFLEGLDLFAPARNHLEPDVWNGATPYAVDALSLAAGTASPLMMSVPDIGLQTPPKPGPGKRFADTPAVPLPKKLKKPIQSRESLPAADVQAGSPGNAGFPPIPLPDGAAQNVSSQAEKARIGASVLAIPMPTTANALPVAGNGAVVGAGFPIPMPGP